MGKFNVNNHLKETVATQNSDIGRADANWREAEFSVKNALQELGKAYFEANQDNMEAEYYKQITNIKKCMDNEILWHQYRLSLEGKLQCEKCGSIITSDSLFCNQCGNSIRAWDFSGLGVEALTGKNVADAVVCRGCGNPLISGAVFCEVCGTKV